MRIVRALPHASFAVLLSVSILVVSCATPMQHDNTEVSSLAPISAPLPTSEVRTPDIGNTLPDLPTLPAATSSPKEACPPGKSVTTAACLVSLVTQAQKMLRDLDTPVIMTERNRMYRRITFALYDEQERTMRTAVIRVPHPLPLLGNSRLGQGTPLFAFESLSPECIFDHRGGMGVARLKMDIVCDGHPVLVLAERHPRIPSSKWRSVNFSPESIAAVVYTPYQPGYHDRAFTSGLVQLGTELWKKDIDKVYSGLRQNAVPSQTYPDRLLGDVMPKNVPMKIGIIEQSDDGEWQSDPKKTAEKVLIEYALNRDPPPFYFANSLADAIGLAQFTNKNGDGTYAWVVRTCGAARLDPVFDPGARDPIAGMTAMLCLLDMELARLPRAVHDLFVESPELALLYLAAAYNGGGGKADKLYDILPPDAIADAVESSDLPRMAFRTIKKIEKKHCRCGRSQVQVSFNSETYNYLRKLIIADELVQGFLGVPEEPGGDSPKCCILHENTVHE